MNIPLAGADLTDSPVVSKDPSSAGDLTPAESGYAPVNGIKMYYEVHGTGVAIEISDRYARTGSSGIERDRAGSNGIERELNSDLYNPVLV